MTSILRKSQSKCKLGMIDPTVAGIDIGSKLIHVSFPSGNNQTRVVEYTTSTSMLHKIAKDLVKSGVRVAVMEATGVYWIPLFEVLQSEEYGLEPKLVDAKSVKNVPGRKTDVVDAQWIQTLWSAGLLRAAFRPPREMITLRELVRSRNGIIKNRQRALLHIEKTLQLMNIKLSAAVADVAGASGMKIVRAICDGQTSPEELAKLRHKTCKKSKDEFVELLSGNFKDHHVFALTVALNQFDFSAGQLALCDDRIAGELEKLPDVTDKPLPRRRKDLRPNGRYIRAGKPKNNTYSFDVRYVLWRKSGVDLTMIPGIAEGGALVIFSELGGINVDAWASEKAFCSWLKLCPGNNVSGGKRRKSKKTQSGNVITQALRMAAMSCKQSKSGIGAFIRRICGRADKLKGMKAGAHKLARIIYQLCRHGTEYVERGEIFREHAYRKRVEKNLRKRAEELGFTLVPRPALHGA